MKYKVGDKVRVISILRDVCMKRVFHIAKTGNMRR